MWHGAAFSPETERLLGMLVQKRPLLARLTKADERLDCLASLAAAGDYRVVPVLLPLMIDGGELSKPAAAAIETLLRGIAPPALAWIDEQARHEYWPAFSYHRDGWWTLSPTAVLSLCHALLPHWSAIGLLASHNSGFVREVVVKELASCTDGREIPFLALRANDWVPPVADSAATLLAQRLQPDNREVALAYLSYIVRTAGQQRRDHRRVLDALRTLLLSDECRTVLSRLHAHEVEVRRSVYRLLQDDTSASGFAVIRAALSDVDAVARRRAVQPLARIMDADAATNILLSLVTTDAAPVVRKEALTVLAERAPDRTRALLPLVLLDRGARVRALARFLVTRLDPSIDARSLYIAALNSQSPRALAVAIDGLGETGTRTDVDLLVGFVAARFSKVRASALRSAAMLDNDRAVPLAVAAVNDVSGLVRISAWRILRRNRPRVDFEALSARLPTLADARVRLTTLRLLGDAPKWDACAYLLAALADPEPAVRAAASRLLDGWTAGFNRSQPQPSPRQLQRIRALLTTNPAGLRQDTFDLLRFAVADR